MKLLGNCPICLTRMTRDKCKTLYYCGHHFHDDCFEEYSNYGSNCPLCRSPIITGIIKTFILDVSMDKFILKFFYKFIPKLLEDEFIKELIKSYDSYTLSIGREELTEISFQYGLYDSLLEEILVLELKITH